VTQDNQLFYLGLSLAYAVVGVQQPDTLMMGVFHQQHYLITFSPFGEVK
jgi:hypothetical protein